MSAASQTQVIAEQIAPPRVARTADRPSFGDHVRSIGRQLAQRLEFTGTEPHWTAWREQDSLDRAPRL